MRNAHCRTWNMERSTENNGNENNTIYVEKYDENY